MKRVHHLLIVIALLTITAGVFAQRRTTEAPMVPSDRTNLAARIARLEDRISNLEIQVRDLREGRTVIRTPVIPRPPNPLPPGWQEREFNGLKYYIVPCDDAVAAPPTTRPIK